MAGKWPRNLSCQLKDRPQDLNSTHHPPPGSHSRGRNASGSSPSAFCTSQNSGKRQVKRKPTSVRSHRQSPAMNATTASFLGIRRRQRAQDLLRESPRRHRGKHSRGHPQVSVRPQAKNAQLEWLLSPAWQDWQPLIGANVFALNSRNNS